MSYIGNIILAIAHSIMWKSKYRGMEANEAKRMRELESENR